jgi:hypothetical protein
MFQNESLLRKLWLVLQTYRASPCNQATYSDLFKSVKKDVWGLGDLRAQKAIMTYASLGLYLSENFLSFFKTGSMQQLCNLKKSPFFFQHSDQVNQLQRNLLFVNPNLLPMQADKYICSLTTTPSKRASIGGEVICSNHSIFNARKRPNGMVAIFRLFQNLSK